jgi:tetratricopeptide (TPR) repeat protein
MSLALESSMKRLIFVMPLLLLAHAYADPADTRSQARMHFQAGTVYFDSGFYDNAIVEYEEAHRLLPLPSFLFNLAQAYRLKGNVEVAETFYRLYLIAKPTGAVADEARTLLHELSELPHRTEAGSSAAVGSVLSTHSSGNAVESRPVKPNSATAPPSMLRIETFEQPAAQRAAPSKRGWRWPWAATETKMVAVTPERREVPRSPNPALSHEVAKTQETTKPHEIAQSTEDQKRNLDRKVTNQGAGQSSWPWGFGDTEMIEVKKSGQTAQTDGR